MGAGDMGAGDMGAGGMAMRDPAVAVLAARIREEAGHAP
jgi:hypothetical protein